MVLSFFRQKSVVLTKLALLHMSSTASTNPWCKFISIFILSHHLHNRKGKGINNRKGERKKMERGREEFLRKYLSRDQ